MSTTVDLVVIGGGPGGYVAAIRAAQLGFSVMCVDARDTLGGVCLNEGCIPSKALLHTSHLYAETRGHLGPYGIEVPQVSLNFPQMMAYKAGVVKELTQGVEFLLRKNKVTRVKGHARLVGGDTVEVSEVPEGKAVSAWTAKRGIVIATGSEPLSFQGLVCDEKRILSSRGALSLEEVPPRMAVLGGGYIGLELGSVFQRLGSQVTVIERADRLVPAQDAAISQGLQRALEKQGLTFRLAQSVTAVGVEKETVEVTLEGQESSLRADVLLVSLGRRPLTRGLGLETQGIQTDDRGAIMVDDHFQTTCRGIYAIGDVIPGPMLAHKAEEEGVAVAEILAGQAGHVNYEVIPSVIYTSPQAASVGATEGQLKERHIPYRTGQFPFRASGRARVSGEDDGEGFVKLLAHRETDRLLGAHILGPHAETLIAEAALAMEFGASAEDLARTCHAHPTYAESLKEAALAISGRALHI